MVNSHTFFAQEIEIIGKISDSLTAVPRANVILKREDKIIAFSISDLYGSYKITNSITKNDNLLLEISALGYSKKQIYIKNLLKDTVINIKLKTRTTHLKEVILTGKKNIQEKDTINYSLKKYTNGSEEYVEDLLKKLPGLTIEKDGKIKYEGIEIKKLLLDGDDLFSKQYTIGSKNISAEMVDSIQTIKHYLENPLLKNIKGSNDIAINLLLKKGISELSGNAKIGYGYKDRRNLHLTPFFLNSSTKAFAVVSYNNLGEDKSPFLTKQNSQEKIIYLGNFSSNLKNKYQLRNNSLFTNLSVLHRFNKKLKLNVKLNYHRDQLNRKSLRNEFYDFGDSKLELIETNKIRKMPKIYDAEIKLNYLKNNFSYLYTSNLYNNEENYNSIYNNNGVLQNISLESKSCNLKQDLVATYKLDQKQALEVKINHTTNKLDQELVAQKSIDLTNPTLPNFQNLEYLPEKFLSELKYFKAFKKAKIHSSLNYKYDKNTIYSSQTQTLLEKERYLQKIKDLSLDIKLNYKLNKFYKLNIKTEAHQIKQNNFFQNTANRFQSCFANYNLNITRNLTRRAKVIIGHSLEQEKPALRYLIPQKILIGERTELVGNVPFQLIKTFSYNLTYNFNDFYNLFKFFSQIKYQKSGKTFVNDREIDTQANLINYQIVDRSNQNFEIILNIEKFLYPISTTISSNSQWGWRQSYSLFNNSGLNELNSRNLMLNLKTRTDLFNKQLGFSQEVNYFVSDYKLENFGKNQFESLNYSNILSLKDFPKNFILQFESDWYWPNLSSNANYLFTNLSLDYIPAKAKFEYQIQINNLSNIKRYERTDVNDILRSKYSYNLLERSILGIIRYKF